MEGRQNVGWIKFDGLKCAEIMLRDDCGTQESLSLISKPSADTLEYEGTCMQWGCVCDDFKLILRITLEDNGVYQGCLDASPFAHVEYGVWSR